MSDSSRKIDVEPFVTNALTAIAVKRFYGFSIVETAGAQLTVRLRHGGVGGPLILPLRIPANGFAFLLMDEGVIETPNGIYFQTVAGTFPTGDAVCYGAYNS